MYEQCYSGPQTFKFPVNLEFAVDVRPCPFDARLRFSRRAPIIAKAQISIVAVDVSGTATAEKLFTVPFTNNPFGPWIIDSLLKRGSGVTGEMGVKWRASVEITFGNKIWLNDGWLSSTPIA